MLPKCWFCLFVLLLLSPWPKRAYQRERYAAVRFRGGTTPGRTGELTPMSFPFTSMTGGCLLYTSERDYALSHQKKVEIPVEKPVLYQKYQNCNQTAYLKAKERYDTQREKLAGRYKTKTVMYEALMFLLIWYSVSTTLFQMILSLIHIFTTSKCYRSGPV